MRKSYTSFRTINYCHKILFHGFVRNNVKYHVVNRTRYHLIIIVNIYRLYHSSVDKLIKIVFSNSIDFCSLCQANKTFSHPLLQQIIRPNYVPLRIYAKI
ncbi:Os07g0445450 [Oryza sativa Japonica Group]|uniref:Os07g0445450 protein n=1 Tax=Oryza sativa subsp. japonica TaxID=39947 RepID=A0A0P0X5M0_ORYSJ|nr:hypothetical protein EE612_038911 [Oryza sativa]BAT01285.1 Os07g0445450 [Oryza sativa Japonica Group]